MPLILASNRDGKTGEITYSRDYLVCWFSFGWMDDKEAKYDYRTCFEWNVQSTIWWNLQNLQEKKWNEKQI